jgi:hypothetical protein
MANWPPAAGFKAESQPTWPALRRQKEDMRLDPSRASILDPWPDGQSNIAMDVAWRQRTTVT